MKRLATQILLFATYRIMAILGGVLHAVNEIQAMLEAKGISHFL